MKTFKTQPTRASKSKGFTLVELMVVILILAVLSSLIFMMANKGRKKANSMQCVQNLRDWSLVFANSASDNNGRLHTPKNWAAISHSPYDPSNRSNPGRSPFVDYWSDDFDVALRLQLEKRTCPCQKEAVSPSGNPAPNYMINRRLSQGPSFLEIHLSSIRRASRKIIFIDGDNGCPLELKSVAEVSRWIEPAADVHGGKVNALFADFHVAPINPKEIEDNWQLMLTP